jgi:hypothetical protein
MIDILRKSVRPGVCWLFSVALVAGFFMGKVSSEIIVPITTMCIGYYFKARDEKQGG